MQTTELELVIRSVNLQQCDAAGNDGDDDTPHVTAHLL